ncbi:hypothetical protein TNCV_2558301 [Trichonephila clavipes]|nr:hypothetical protein TNCV_2558301 [Trichonephila clavipes]
MLSLNHVSNHVEIPCKERAWTYQREIPLTLRRAKSIITIYIDKYMATTQKKLEHWKAIGNPGHCRSYPEVSGKSRGRCPLSPNQR